MLNFLKLGVPIVASGFAYASSQKPILNDSKRSFYSDSTADNVPGKPQDEDFQLAKLMEQSKNKPNTILETATEKIRTGASGFIDRARKSYVKHSNNYFRKERQAMDSLSSLHDRTEPFWPNSIYILTGLMTGLVFTRKSNVFMKTLAPVVCGIAAFDIFMPNTFKNTGKRLLGIEKEKLPTIYNKQSDVQEHTASLIKKSIELKNENQKNASIYYEKTRQKIGKAAGLKVDEPVTDKKD